MTLSFKQILSLTLGFTLLLVGCTKKPERPTPELTQTGPTDGGQMGGNQPASSVFVAPPTTTLNSGLTDRGSSSLDLLAPQSAFQTVYFDFDKSSIKPSERSKLADVVKFLNANPTAHLMLEGHCDWRGTAEYNMALGDRRATSVLKYLTTAKIDPSRLDHISKGSLEAKEKGTDEEMGKDRRVDIRVVTGSGAPATGTP
jgi:peptidoglycan-associated lipoprotein